MAFVVSLFLWHTLFFIVSKCQFFVRRTAINSNDESKQIYIKLYVFNNYL